MESSPSQGLGKNFKELDSYSHAKTRTLYRVAGVFLYENLLDNPVSIAEDWNDTSVLVDAIDIHLVGTNHEVYVHI